MRASYRELLIRLRSLLSSGVPIKEALASVAHDGRGHDLAGSLLADVSSGRSLGDAAAAQTGRIPVEHAALIRAGEESGRLPDVLDGILADIEARLEMRRSLLQQTAYPLTVLCLALVLPPLSLFAATGKVIEGAVLHLALFLASLLAVLLMWRGPGIVPRSSLRLRLERLFLALPFFGSLIADRILARALALEGLLLEAGMTFETSLPLVADAVGWELFRREIEEAEGDIRGGRTAAEGLRRLSRLDRSIADRLAAAESAGSLDAALRSAGAELRERYLHRLRVTMRVVPVVVYLFAALVVLRTMLEVMQGRVMS